LRAGRTLIDMRRKLRFTFTVRRAAATGQPALPPVTLVVEDVGPDPDRVDEALRAALAEERPSGWRVVRLPGAIGDIEPLAAARIKAALEAAGARVRIRDSTERPAAGQ
jgi:hypothetical protein